MWSPLDLLEFNSTQSFIVPSAGQYPHLWLWDACFHAIVLAHLRPELAFREMDALLATQQPDGMIPHITFNPHVDASRYRPNPADWQTGGPHSGITQTPMVAPAAKLVFQKTGNRAFLKRAYPQIVHFHRWLKKVRDPDDTGLVAILHPWESGMDNSPAFDGLKDTFLREHLPPGFEPPPRADTKRVPLAQRPTDDYYRFYWGLIRVFQQARWNQRAMMLRSPFRVADVLFNSVWAKANQDLAKLAWVLGRQADQAKFLAWATQTRRALRRYCWHPKDGFFYSRDLESGQPIRVKTIGGFMPLYAEAATAATAESLVEHLMDRREFYYHLGVPSASFRTPGFDRYRYWRGPVWINMHWLLSRGLLNYDYLDIAAKIVEKSQQLVKNEGYWEYYDPFTGKGLGASYFSWSTLTDIMTPLKAPPELHQPVLVISPQAAARDPQLKTLYLHPGIRSIQLTVDRITSGPPVFTADVLAAVQARALESLTPVQEADFDRRLRQVAEIIHRLVQEKRGAWQDYPRICDLVSVAGYQVFSGLGYRCRVQWTPDLHYFLRIISPEGRPWIVDLSPTQFSWHPVSRIPLLFECASLAMEADLRQSRKPSLALELLLRETQLAVHRNWMMLERERMDRHERKAFLYGGRHHQQITRQLAVRMPLSRPFFVQYLRWLDRLLHRARRRQTLAGVRGSARLAG